MSDESWKDLYGSWKRSLDQPVSREPQQPGHWFSIWRMILGHAWFQQQLRVCVGHEILSSGLPPDLADDIEHEVFLLLAGKLARRRDLGMDLELAEQKFPAFMGTIIRNDCRQAARKLRRQFLRSPSLLSPQSIEDQAAENTGHVELSLEIEELNDPQRTILLLSVKGMTLKEIARQLNMNYTKVCREYHEGYRLLKKTCEPV